VRRAGRWAAGAGLALLLAFGALPLLWMVAASFTPEERLFAGDWPGPGEWVLDHYRALWDEQDFWVPLRNSFLVAGATTAVCVPIGALAAWAIARLRFRGKALVLGFVLTVSLFPQISLVAPLYLLLRSLRLIDTFPGLVLPYLTFALPLTVWFLTGFFRQLPVDLEEAARVDGATRWQSFTRVSLPLALPGLATTAILTFLYCWNEFLFALSFTLGPERHTVPVAIALFRGQYQVPWGQILAAATLATVPAAAVVLAFQRRIVQGLTAGAVKG
jgi:ABC-type glycerol-3-phosphate transport system permease component